MRLDGSVSGWGAWVLAAWLLGGIAYSLKRFGIVPKREHLRDPRGSPHVAFWNVLSGKKWTPEGIALHRRVLASSAKMFAALVVVWIVLDLLT